MFQIIKLWIKDWWRGNTFGGRSSQWPRVRKEFLEKHFYCSICGGTKKLEVHHIQNFRTHPELELDTDNLITLCEAKKYGLNCHLLIGHCGNYKKQNYDILKDAYYWSKKINE